MPALPPSAFPAGIDTVLLSTMSNTTAAAAIHGVATDSSTNSVGNLLGNGVSLPNWAGLDFRDSQNLDLILVPFGLLLLFFGTFLLKPALITSCYLQHGIIIGMLSTISLQLSDDHLTGYLLGVCVAWTLPDSRLHWVVMIVFAIVFGIMYTLIPKHVSIIATAYGGAFIMFYGMSLIDASSTSTGGGRGLLQQQQDQQAAQDLFFILPSFDFNLDVKHFNLHDLLNVPDLTFSVLSFLIIACLGAGVQLMLLASQHHSSGHRNMSQSRYVPIP